MATHSLTFVIFAHWSLRERPVARPVSTASHESRLLQSDDTVAEGAALRNHLPSRGYLHLS
jgi:hypothetical protein